MDEPTNHLDMESIESLNTALEKFTGTLVFVSHDREFVSSLATRIIEIRSDGTIVDYLGSYEEYLASPVNRSLRHAAGGEGADQPHAIHVRLVVGRLDVFDVGAVFGIGPAGQRRPVGKAQEEESRFRLLDRDGQAAAGVGGSTARFRSEPIVLRPA